MGFYHEEKKNDQGPMPAASIIGALVALIIWWRGSYSFSKAAAIGAAAAFIIWLISKLASESDGKIKYDGATTSSSPVESSWFGGGSDRKSESQGKTALIPLGVGAAVAWGLSYLIGGYVIALIIGAVVALGIGVWLEVLEEERKRKEREKGTMSTALAFGAAAVGVAAWGMSSSSSREKEKEKMMKAPGRDYYMPRKDFENSPSVYFRNLRGK